MSDSTQKPPPEDPTGQPMGQPSGYSTPPPPPGGGYQPAPPPGYAPSTVGQPADLGLRFVARLIDFILLGIVNFIITLVIVGAIMGASASGFGGFTTGGSYAAAAVSAILSAVIYLGYFTFMESRMGNTVGKMLLKLQTRGPGGGNPTTEEALKRNAWTAIGIIGIIPIIGLVAGLLELAAVIAIMVTISNSPTKQGWHDNFAGGTQVIRAG